MIKKSQQNKIKKALKSGENGYYETIAIYLREQKIYNAKGEEFSESMVRMMLTQPISHARLEKAIFNCYESHIAKLKAEEARRKKLLKTA